MKIKKMVRHSPTECSLADAELGEPYWAPSSRDGLVVIKLTHCGCDEGCRVLWLFPDRSVFSTVGAGSAKETMLTEFAEGESLTFER